MTIMGFSIAEAQTTISPLFLFVLGIVLYAIFIFKFYLFISRRDIISLNLQRYSESFLGFLKSILNAIFYTVEYLIIFPILIFFWFTVFAIVLSVLSKAGIENILLISMALVGSIRVTTYYNEELSKDLSKMLPFALLGVFLVDISYFSFAGSMETIKMIPSMWKVMIYYLLFVVLLEFILRIMEMIISPFTKKEEIKK
jgi:hypothetical protein